MFGKKMMMRIPVSLRRTLAAIPNLSLILAPIIFSPLLLIESEGAEYRCAYLVLLIATLWAFNPIPLPITSMLPIVLLPLLSIASTETVCAAYLKASNMLFFGCLTLALAIEKSGLHLRIALKVLIGAGAQFRWILLTLMLTTAGFSMWIVSTAAVAMMLPIADEIFANLFDSLTPAKSTDILIHRHNRKDQEFMMDQAVIKQKSEINGLNLISVSPKITETNTAIPQSMMVAVIMPNNSSIFEDQDQEHNNYYQSTKIKTKFDQNENQINEKENADDEDAQDRHHREAIEDLACTLTEKRKSSVRKMFYLCIAYAATIGSVSTLTSNGPNLVMKDILEEHFDNRDPVDYGSWLIFATPAGIVNTLVCWQIFYWLYFNDIRISIKRRRALQQHLAKKYERLGPMTFHEWSVLSVFIVMIALYVLYKPQFFDGWLSLFADAKTAPKMASAAILCVALLFVIPAKPKWRPDLTRDALLDWRTIQTKLEWGVIMIRGGGFALADAVKSSGLSRLIGVELSRASAQTSTTGLIVALSVAINILIELFRTSATAAVVIPVTIKVAENLAINPLKIIVPIVTSCAYAFVTPVGTTTNTLIYYHGNLRISEMIIPGIIAKIITMSVMAINTFIFGNFLFGFDDDKPEWL